MEIESGDKSLSNECIYNVSLWSSSLSRIGFFFFFNLFLIVTTVNLNTILVTVKKNLLD